MKKTGQTPLEMKLVTCPALTMPRLHTRTRKQTHTQTRIVTGVHIHIRSILSIALLGHTHTHTHTPAAGESFAFELGLKRAICILLSSLSSLSASALPISLPTGYITP